MSSNTQISKVMRFNKIVQEFSIPLITGVIVALIWANSDFHGYEHFLETELIPGFSLFNHPLTFHFIVNDIFMVFFFGLAAMEITVSFLPGGSLSPMSKAINPLMGTVGGVVGPVGVFFVLCYTLNLDNLLASHSMADIVNGWGIPTATDIALAWLAARIIFGKNHPAISFLLLLAIVDDAIGLVIIAVFYPSPEFPVEPSMLLINVFAIGVAWALKINGVKKMWVYLLLAGLPSWIGLLLAHVHPALSLVPIIPFLPSKQHERMHYPPLYQFEHVFKYPVDVGLFMFGLANAGVPFSGINQITWIILASLIVGKTLGIGLLSYIAYLMKFPLPEHVTLKHLPVIGIISGLGLTVALFVSGQAYTDLTLQGAAKMGALFSVAAFILAFVWAKIIRLKKID